MSKVCAIKSCINRTKNSRKKKKLQLSFFQATDTSKRLEKWTKCLGINLKNSDYICQLHFKEEDIKCYDNIIINGKSNIMPLLKKKLSEGALPTLGHQYKLDLELQQQHAVPISINSQQKQLNINQIREYQQPRQQQILKNKNKGMQKAFVEQCSNNDHMNIQEDTLNNLQQKIVKNIEHKQNCQETINNLRDWMENVSILPEFWSFSIKRNELEFMRVDPAAKHIKYHIRVNQDLSVTVICSNNQEITTDRKITALDDLYKYLKSVEKWPVCVGTLISSRKYAEKCKGVVVRDESYYRMQINPRCKSCRYLRNQLLTQKKHYKIMQGFENDGRLTVPRS